MNKWILLLIFLSGCVSNKVVLTYPESSVTETKQKILDRDIWVLEFGDQRKNSAVGLKREGHTPEEWIRIKTDTPIVDLVTQGVKTELIEAGYPVAENREPNLLVTGEVKKFESHYIFDEPPFALAMAQLLVTVVAYDKEKDTMELVYQEEFLAGAQKEEILIYSIDLFADSLIAALQRVCQKIAASEDLLTALRDYPNKSNQTSNLLLTGKHKLFQ
jgi:hypothetical protein